MASSMMNMCLSKLVRIKLNNCQQISALNRSFQNGTIQRCPFIYPASVDATSSSYGLRHSSSSTTSTSDQQPEVSPASLREEDSRPQRSRRGQNTGRGGTRAKGVRFTRNKPYSEPLLPKELDDYRQKFPEFLPFADFMWRNPIAEKLERRDMIKRRTVIDIPEFYVGSVLKIVISDPNAPGKESFFVGICIYREAQGLRHNITLRNVVDNQGVEIRYDLYNPTIRSIEVLRLEKRLDDHLIYLRDAYPEYSTFPFDMQPEPHPEGAPVPVNPLKVKMKKMPWSRRWETYDLKGIEKLEDVPDWLYIKSRHHNRFWDPNKRFDLLTKYYESVPEEDQLEIWQEVDKLQQATVERRKAERRRRLLQEAAAAAEAKKAREAFRAEKEKK